MLGTLVLNSPGVMVGLLIEEFAKELIRVLVNHEWGNLFDSTNVTHLVRTGSDDSPLLIISNKTTTTPIKYFKFLDFWTKEVDFLSIVEQAWSEDQQGSPLWKFYPKLKNTCKKLSEWSKNSIGNIFNNIKALEEKVADLESKTIIDNSSGNRSDLNQANAEFIMAYKKEEAFWRQKSGIKWFVEGEINSKFLHSVVNGKKRGSPSLRLREMMTLGLREMKISLGKLFNSSRINFPKMTIKKTSLCWTVAQL